LDRQILTKMRTFLPLISGAFAMDLTMTANSLDTIDLEWTCDAEPDFTVTYQMLRPGNGGSSHPDFAPQTASVTGATTTSLTGLNGPIEYNVEVCSDTVNSTCGCSSGKFRTQGSKVYINSIQHYNGTGAVGGQSLQGAFFFDDNADCVSAAEITFASCDVNVTVHQASDPAVRQYPGSSTNNVQIAVSSAYRGNYVTFNAVFDSTTDVCWNGVLNLGSNPALDNAAVNETIDANTDYMGSPANDGVTIFATAVDADTLTTTTVSPIDLLILVQADVFDQHGNNVTDDLGANTGIAMQNQTNFAIQGLLANATTPLNEDSVVCGWSVAIALNADCAGAENVEGSLSFTNDGAGGFTADAAAGVDLFFFQGQIPAPATLGGCGVDDLEASTASVTLQSFN